MGTQDIVAMTGEQIQQLATNQLSGMTNTLLGVIETQDLAGLSMEQADYLTASKSAAFSTEELAVMPVSPIVLDLDGNGVSTLSVGSGVAFDVNADGEVRKTGWVSATDGLLVRDLNADGKIENGTELFGSATKLADGSTAKDGYQALAELDGNADGVIDAQDAGYASLQVWVDGDSDGVTDAGELRGLIEAGVAAINLDAVSSTARDNGNQLGLTGSYTATDGTTHAAADVWFRQGEAVPPQIADLLADAPALLDGSGTPPEGSSGTVSVTTAAVQRPTTSLDEELLKAQSQNPLI
jgi:hypothetical protein